MVKGLDWGWMGLEQVNGKAGRGGGGGGDGRGLKKSIRVRQGTGKCSVGSSQPEDQEV